MKYHYNADKNALTCVIAPVIGFSSASFTDITTCVARASYSGYQDGFGISYCYFAGITAVPHCIMAAYCISRESLLGAILFNKINKFNKDSIK